MQTLKHPVLTICLASVLALASACVHAGAMPEFGPSVEFDSAGPQPTVAKLKGKAVIVLFFQSSDKLSNVWSGKLIKEMQEAYSANKSVVLLAIKTDGGGIAAARGYLTSKGANPDHWVIGSDTGAKYSSALVGDPLWYYVLVGADGTIADRGKAGVTHKVGPEKEIHYSLANPTLLSKCGKLTTVLPADKHYAPAVSGLARLAEAGDAERALALCAALLSKPKERQAAADLLSDLQPIVEKRMNERIALRNDAAADTTTRYDALNDLARMAKDLKTHPLAAKAAPLLAKAKSDPAMLREARAESAYRMTMTRLQKASPRDFPRFVKELESLSKQHPGTKYGLLAADSAEQLATSVAADGK